MPFTQKPGVDWVAVEASWRSGETSYNLAMLWGVAKQTIDARAKRLGWERKGGKTGRGWLEVVQRTWVEPVGDKDTPEIRAAILESLTDGLSMGAAAQLCGLSRSALDAWRERDHAFNSMVDAARAQFVRGQANNVKSAGDRGDWRASSWLLERHHASRADYAAPTPAAMGGLTVNFNLASPWAETGVTIQGNAIASPGAALGMAEHMSRNEPNSAGNDMDSSRVGANEKLFPG